MVSNVPPPPFFANKYIERTEPKQTAYNYGTPQIFGPSAGPGMQQTPCLLTEGEISFHAKNFDTFPSHFKNGTLSSPSCPSDNEATCIDGSSGPFEKKNKDDLTSFDVLLSSTYKESPHAWGQNRLHLRLEIVQNSYLTGWLFFPQNILSTCIVQMGNIFEKQTSAKLLIVHV